MAEITAAIVGKLREMTSAGLMECKKALTESAGDMDKAVDILRKKGAASAEKKASRDAHEGVIATSIAAGDGRSRGRWRRQKTNIHSRIRGFACPAHCGRPVIGRFPTIDIEKTHIFRE